MFSRTAIISLENTGSEDNVKCSGSGYCCRVFRSEFKSLLCPLLDVCFGHVNFSYLDIFFLICKLEVIKTLRIVEIKRNTCKTLVYIIACRKCSIKMIPLVLSRDPKPRVVPVPV